jgi:hypothetical protein
MNSYVLDFKTNNHVVGSCQYTYDQSRMYVEYFFKIDINGNINISKFHKCQNGEPYFQGRGIEQVLSINDNIQIPDYFIDIIKFLINPITNQDIKIFKEGEHSIAWVMGGKRPDLNKLSSNSNLQLTERYWEIVVDTITKIKEQVKENVENPQCSLDLKTQLDTYISKTKQQQEYILELEKKIENIQTAYFDTLNDNKKLKEKIKTKDNKETVHKCEINKLSEHINTRKQLDEYNKNEQKKMEELEKEKLWKEYKLRKQNYNPLYH